MTRTPRPALVQVNYDEVLDLARAAVRLYAAYGDPRNVLNRSQLRALSWTEPVGDGAELRLDEYNSRGGQDRAVDVTFARLNEYGAERFYDLCIEEGMLVLCPDPVCNLSNGITEAVCRDCGMPLPRDFAAEAAERRDLVVPMPGDVVRLTAAPKGWSGPLPVADGVIDGVRGGRYRYPDDRRANLVFDADVFRSDAGDIHLVRCLEGTGMVRIDLTKLRNTSQTRTLTVWRRIPGRPGRFAYQARVNLWEADPDAIIPDRRTKR